MNQVAQAKGKSANYIARLKTVFFYFVLEGATADAQELGCLGSILIGFI